MALRLRLASLIIVLLFTFPACAGWMIAQDNGSTATFTPSWQTLREGAGGQITSIAINPDGTISSRNDTYGGYFFRPSVTCTGWGSAFAAPCHEQVVTSNSVAGIAVNAYLGGTVELIACNSNTNVAYMLWNSTLYVSNNYQSASRRWTPTSQTTTQNPNDNSTKGAGPFLYCDPANPDIIYVSTPAGVKYSTNGTAGAGSTSTATFTSVTGIGSVGSVPAFFAVDPNSTTSGGVTQHFFVIQQGGIYQTTNGGSAGGGSFSLTTSSPSSSFQRACVDNFVQLWVVDTTTTVRKFASGAWSSLTPGGSPANIVCDLTSASLGANHIILGTYTGDLVITSNNGSTWSGPNFANTVSASGAQPGWLATANLQGGGALSMNNLSIALDSSGKLWMASGVGVFTMASPAATGTYVANTVGIEQLVATRIVVPTGTWPVAAVWDRGAMAIFNPDAYPASQYPNGTSNSYGSLGQILGGWDIDTAGTTAGFVTAWIISNVGQGTAPASSPDGGHSWTLWPTIPAVVNQGGNVAASTTSNWITVPGCPSANCGGTSGTPVMNYTTDAAAHWNTSSFTGGTPGVFVGQVGVGVALAADRVTTGNFCAVDGSQQFWKSTNQGATFAKTAATVDGFTNLSFLKPAPGKASNYWYASGNAKIWKSTDGCTSFSAPNANMQAAVFGFGITKPGTSTYPTLYTYGSLSGVWGLYQSTDGGATHQIVNIPTNQQSYPANSFDGIVDLTGDPDIYGQIYVGFRGSGGAYIETADACPGVKFANVYPTIALTGASVTLTAQHFGYVPVTGVQFQLDGTTNIGSVQTGQGSYSVSFNASGQTPGAHTLSVIISGNGCTGTGSTVTIPITTSFLMQRDLPQYDAPSAANDNMPMWINQAA